MDNFISEININKVRHLQNIIIKLSQEKRKHLILTGKNGSGKTSVLNAIRDYLKVFEDADYHCIGKSPIEQLMLKKDKILSKIGNYYKGFKIFLNSESDTYEKYQNGNFILAYFDAKRLSQIEVPKSVEKVKLEDKYSIDNSPCRLFVKYLVDLKTQQAFARNENDMSEVNKIEIWFKNFEKSLKELFGDDNLSLQFDYKNYHFEINQAGKNPFGFDVLSDGYSALLNIIMDLILRMEKKQSGKYDIEGIVLIDEVETHLHIDLQKKNTPIFDVIFPQNTVYCNNPFTFCIELNRRYSDF